MKTFKTEAAADAEIVKIITRNAYQPTPLTARLWQMRAEETPSGYIITANSAPANEPEQRHTYAGSDNWTRQPDSAPAVWKVYGHPAAYTETQDGYHRTGKTIAESDDYYIFYDGGYNLKNKHTNEFVYPPDFVFCPLNKRGCQFPNLFAAIAAANPDAVTIAATR